ncbi:VanZ family protein [Peterkaempfera sp. SMS 1(5)a]|uniref:VanZ family protein n=1 Tax=Peterkaempfera podocarpi TaxID=3232308 RepID=UPI00366F10DD
MAPPAKGRKPSAAKPRKDPAKPRKTPAAKPRTAPSPQSGQRSPLAALLRALIMLVAFAAMVAFAAVLARVTLTPSPASVPISHSNLHPGASLRLYLNQPSVREAVKQIGGNVALGVPFGVLLPILVPRARGLLWVLLATGAVMLLVELVQGSMVQGRSFDIDDVILNTAGSLLGYLLLGRRISRAVHPRRRHWWQRRREPANTV